MGVSGRSGLLTEVKQRGPMVAPACPAGLETAAQLPPAAPTDMCAAAAAVLLCLQVEAGDLQRLGLGF